jgi:hypothetical protein
MSNLDLIHLSGQEEGHSPRSLVVVQFKEERNRPR